MLDTDKEMEFTEKIQEAIKKLIDEKGLSWITHHTGKEGKRKISQSLLSKWRKEAPQKKKKSTIAEDLYEQLYPLIAEFLIKFFIITDFFIFIMLLKIIIRIKHIYLTGLLTKNPHAFMY